MVGVHDERLVELLQVAAKLLVIVLLLLLAGNNFRHDYCLFLEPIRSITVRREISLIQKREWVRLLGDGESGEACPAGEQRLI